MSPLKRTITKQILLHVCKHVKSNIRQIQITKSCSAVEQEIIKNETLCSNVKSSIPFDQVLNTRRQEASRSIVVQVKNEKSYDELLTYCLNFGNVRNTFYYSLDDGDAFKNFVLIEFENISGAAAALYESQHSELDNVVPVTSNFLWFRSGRKKLVVRTDLPKLRVESNDLPSVQELIQLLSTSNKFSDDIILLYNKTKLGEIGTRLRFLTALQLETAFKGVFSFCKVLPFGSSVNSFGKLNCDLDLVFEFNQRKYEESSRLVFQSKTLDGMSKIHNQRHLETVADVIQYFLPGCYNTRRILKARIPIIKYKHELTGVECDLSSTNLSGVYMSELLFTLGTFDWRVCPLVFAVRFWAKEINLTNPTPGRWVTNFSLTLLVLFHLQYNKIIPTFQTLVKNRRPEDVKIFVDSEYKSIDCGFLTDLTLLKDSGTNTNDDSLFSLLFKFFEFYSTFDFRSNALSVYSGSVIPKPVHDPMYIVNPLEKGLNVSKNVSQEECDKMRMQFRSAAWNIECSINATDEKLKKWGLLDLIQCHLLNRSGFPRTRNMKGTSQFTVKTLFDNEL